MAHSQPHLAPSAPQHSATQLVRYAMLVPEAPLLAALVAAHVATGGPPLTALLGVALTVWFGARTSLLAAARRAIGRADYRHAERYLRLGKGLYPLSADASALEGALRLARGRPDEAAAALRLAIARFPNSGHLHALLAAALLEAGDAVGGLVEARRAAELDPGCAPAYLHMASAEQALGSADLAERHLRQGLDRVEDPADEALLRCGLAGLLVAVGRLAEAQLSLAGVPALLERCGPAQQASLHFYLGDLYSQIGELEAARGHFSASERLDPNGRLAAAAWRAARL